MTLTATGISYALTDRDMLFRIGASRVKLMLRVFDDAHVSPEERHELMAIASEYAALKISDVPPTG
jgi:hypothetical protein